MKLYHIDRAGNLNEGSTVDYLKNISIEKPFLKEYCNEIEKIYPEGLSFHGRKYFLDGYKTSSNGIDIIFEYERRLNYPEKLSRYQSFFAFDINGVIDFIELEELEFEFFKIYEVDYHYYEKYNLNLVRGWSQYDTLVRAKYYWENKEDYDNTRKPIYEYLLKLPIKMKKEVKLENLRKEYNKINNKEK